MRTATDGSRSDGLRMKAFPQAMDTGYIQSGTMAGKLNGVMPATTPTGWRTAKLSMPAATPSEYSPFRSCGMPQANSTTSIPRASSPVASESVLPCSADSIAASSSVRLLRRLRNSNITAARLRRGRCAPGGLGPAGGRDRMIHIRRRRHRDPCGHRACRRIEDIAGSRRSAGPAGSGNEMLDGIHRSVLSGRRGWRRARQPPLVRFCPIAPLYGKPGLSPFTRCR